MSISEDDADKIEELAKHAESLRISQADDRIEELEQNERALIELADRRLRRAQDAEELSELRLREIDRLTGLLVDRSVDRA